MKQEVVLLVLASIASLLRTVTGIEFFNELVFLIIGAYFGMAFKK